MDVLDISQRLRKSTDVGNDVHANSELGKQER